MRAMAILDRLSRLGLLLGFTTEKLNKVLVGYDSQTLMLMCLLGAAEYQSIEHSYAPMQQR